MQGMPMMGGMGSWLIWLVVLLVGLLVFALLQSQSPQAPSQQEEKRKGITKSAREIADERLAAGDISPEEHREIVDELETPQSQG